MLIKVVVVTLQEALSQGANTSHPATRGFDGNTATVTYSQDIQGWLYFNPPAPLTVNTSVEIWARTPQEYKINGIQVLPNPTDGVAQWRLLKNADDSPFTGQLTELACRFTSGGGISGWHAIKIDGKLLIDQGIGDLGDTRVEYQTNGGQGTIVSVNTDDNTLLIKDLDSNTRE